MDEEERNFCCLVLLLSRVGLVKLRKLFIDEWNSVCGFVPWTDCPQNGADLLTKFSPLPYERDKVQSGDSTTWDLSLFVKVLLYSRPPFVHIPNKPLVDGLLCLKETRNTLCHTGSGKIESAEFCQLYNNACHALLLVGALPEEFKKVEDDVQQPLNKVLSVVKQCSAYDKDILKGIDTSIKGLQTGLEEIKLDQKQILKEIQMCGASKSSDLPSEDMESYSLILKEAITKQTDLLPKGIAQRKLKTDDIFTNLTLHHGNEGRSHQTVGEVDRRAYKTLTEIKQCHEIFVDENKENNPKSILVSGEPGIGKTLFSQKIVRDWSNNTISIPGIKFTYLLTFKQLSNKELTLRELLNLSPLLNERTLIDETILKFVIEHPEQLFVVLDGFDEFKDQDQIVGDFECRFPNDSKAKMPVAALVSKLIQKKILSDSVIMVTSRPREANGLDQKIYFDRYVEISGFSEQRVIQYVERYFNSKPEEVKRMALEKVKGTVHYISFGRVPFCCLLMCVLIEWEIENDTNNNIPLTLTAFYGQVIQCIEGNYNRAILSLDKKSASLAVDKTLDNFSKLAKHLAEQNRFSFTLEDLKNLALTENESLYIKSSNLIFCYPVSSGLPFQEPTYEYSFTHFTIQEFFVSRYLVKNGVMMAQGTTEMVYIFMSGLLSLKKDDKIMLELLECVDNQSDIRNYRRVILLKCLYEYGKDKSLTSQELTTNRDYRYWNSKKRIELSRVTDTDCGAITMLVDESSVASSSPPYRLHIRGSSLSCYGLKTLLSSLTKPTCCITKLRLNDCKLDDQCVEYFSQYLSDTKLVELYLWGNKITDVGVNHILNYMPSNLTELRLDVNPVSDDCKKTTEQFCKDNFPALKFII